MRVAIGCEEDRVEVLCVFGLLFRAFRLPFSMEGDLINASAVLFAPREKWFLVATTSPRALTQEGTAARFRLPCVQRVACAVDFRLFSHVSSQGSGHSRCQLGRQLGHRVRRDAALLAQLWQCGIGLEAGVEALTGN